MTEPTRTVKAGRHWEPLDEVHVQLGDEGIFQHLAEHHDNPVRRKLGPDRARLIHGFLHGEEGEP